MTAKAHRQGINITRNGPANRVHPEMFQAFQHFVILRFTASTHGRKIQCERGRLERRPRGIVSLAADRVSWIELLAVVVKHAAKRKRPAGWTDVEVKTSRPMRMVAKFRPPVPPSEIAK